MLLHTQALLHTDSTHDPHTARPSADQPADQRISPADQRISGSAQRIGGSVDEGAHGSADQWMRQPADQRISPRIGGSADQPSGSAHPRISHYWISGARGSRSPRIYRSADHSADQRISPWMNQRSQRINGSADHSADQRISPWISGARGSTDQRITRRISRAGGSADQRITTTGSVQVRSQVFSTANMSHNRRVIRTRQPGFFFFFALASGTWCRRGQGLPSELSTLHAPLPNFAFTAIIAEHLFASHLLSLAPFSQPTQIIL